MNANRRPLPSSVGRGRPRALLAVVLLSAALAGCQESTGPAEAFFVTPDTASIFVGGAVQLTALAAPGAVAWSSTNSQVATVVSETGYVRGISNGTVTISAVSGAAVATAEVTVLRPPALSLSMASTEFAMLVGASDPPSQTVAIVNAGDGPLGGVAVGGVSYDAGQPSGWLTATIDGSSAPATLTLTAHGAGLPRGVYGAVVEVDADVDNAPLNVAVTLAVQTLPSIVVSRTTVPMAGIPSSTATETVDLTNGGDRPLTDLGTQIAYAAGQATGWLGAALGATTAPATLTLTATIGTLGVGTYDATVTVASSVEGVAPVDLAVHLTVSPGPAIALSRTTVTAQAPLGTSPPPTTVTITNGGGGTLSGLTLGTVLYGQDEPTGWLSPALSGATAPSVITLAISSASLAEGSYTATVPVQSPVASNNPVELTVSLAVTPTPVISLNRTLLTFATWRGGALPDARSIRVTNAAGNYPLTALKYSLAYSAGASGWLDAAWENGSTEAPASLLVGPSSELSEGTYTATVTVATDLPGVEPKDVAVSYQLRSFTANLHSSLTSSCSGCHYAAGGQSPALDGTSNQSWTRLQPYLTPGSPTASEVYRRISGLDPHSGGTFSGLSSLVYAWILAGAPFH